jgi:tRNA (adenine57-N1/adenine58-N1)-methyltransferase
MFYFFIQRERNGWLKLLQRRNCTHISESLMFHRLLEWNMDLSLNRLRESAYIMKSERKTQIVYPKDFGYIASRTGLQNGSVVLEIGTGSGALTTFMASIVKPTGHIYTYDINSDFMAIARKNLEKAGMLEHVTMHLEDPHLGLSVREADVAVVDLGDPWSVVAHVHVSLKGSGAFVAICPTMNQLEKTANTLKQGGFADVDCVEIMIRDIEAREGMTRPSMRMIGHTTYLIFARKVESSSLEYAQTLSSPLA